MKRFKILLPAMLLLATFAVLQMSCDNDQVLDNAKGVLATSKATWQDFQDVAAKLYMDGKITEAQWHEFILIDAKYRASHNTAVSALKVYEQVRSKPAEQAVFAALAELDTIIATTADLIRAWKGGA